MLFCLEMNQSFPACWDLYDIFKFFNLSQKYIFLFCFDIHPGSLIRKYVHYFIRRFDHYFSFILKSLPVGNLTRYGGYTVFILLYKQLNYLVTHVDYHKINFSFQIIKFWITDVKYL